jgi:hypothetical protein
MVKLDMMNNRNCFVTILLTYLYPPLSKEPGVSGRKYRLGWAFEDR